MAIIPFYLSMVIMVTSVKALLQDNTCLGELLSDNLGNGYYSIGTDAQETQF